NVTGVQTCALPIFSVIHFLISSTLLETTASLKISEIFWNFCFNCASVILFIDFKIRNLNQTKYVSKRSLTVAVIKSLLGFLIFGCSYCNQSIINFLNIL